ncbi:MAG: energy-coupling factor ABC transporter permease [Planctomycetaceae bacterium]|nr:energy-coupling factor ABC transporter permease [Planctomycetaceae bacterium]
MHIPDGLLEPEVCLVTGAAAATAVGYSLHKVKQQANDKLVPLTGVIAALIFAGQMVNFPLALFSLPVSGHLMGGVLAAILLGPWAGCLAMTLVLLVQAFLFSDGGILCLGTNILHMAVLGCWGGYACFLLVKQFFREDWKGTAFGAMSAAWFTVMAAASLLCLELYFSLDAQEFSLSRFSALMLPFHAVIGLGEGLITLLVLKAVAKQRPELLTIDSCGMIAPSPRRFALTTMASALAVTFFLAPWASASPDGLEAAVEQQGLAERQSTTFFGLLNDYQIPWISAHGEALSVGLAGALGVLMVFLLAFLLGRLMRLSPAIAGVKGE